jgi:short-subunit dehydrogenase
MRQRRGWPVPSVRNVVGRSDRTPAGRFRNLGLATELGMVDLHVTATVRLAHTAVRAMAGRGVAAS